MDARRQEASTEDAPVVSALLGDLSPHLAQALCDLVDRVRHLPESRLVGCPTELGGSSRAAAAHALAQLLADAAAGVEHASAAGPPASRALPDLGPFAVGDQLAVTGADLLAAVAGSAGDVAVWAPGGRRQDLTSVLRECLEAVAVLRPLI